MIWQVDDHLFTHTRKERYDKCQGSRRPSLISRRSCHHVAQFGPGARRTRSFAVQRLSHMQRQTCSVVGKTAEIGSKARRVCRTDAINSATVKAYGGL